MKRPAHDVILDMFDTGYEMDRREILEHLRSDNYTDEESVAALDEIIAKKFIHDRKGDGIYRMDRRRVPYAWEKYKG
jgi:hypothetical protein